MKLKDFHGKVYDIVACCLFVVIFIIVYHDILFLESPFMGVNFIVPAANMDYYITSLFSNWFPAHLGFPNQPGLFGILQFILAAITGNNLTLTSKLLLCYIPVAALSMYFFLLKHFKVSRPASFVGSILFAFSPSVITDFTDITFWGYATLPIVFNYMLNLIKSEKTQMRDILIFSMGLAFTIEFIPQILPIMMFAFLLFILVYLANTDRKVEYFIAVVKRFTLSILLFLLLSFQTIRGIIVYLLGGGGLVIEKTVFFYSDAGFINTFRVIGGDYLSMVYQYPNPIGFTIPILAFITLIFIKKSNASLNLFSLALLVIFIIGLAYSIKENLPWIVWLNEHTPILKPLVAPQRPLYLVSFSYSCMISITVSELIRRLQTIKFPPNSWILRKINEWRPQKFRVNKKKAINVISVIIVSSLVLSINFLYSPYFDINMHKRLYYSLPSSYEGILSWLKSNDPYDNYRVLIIPIFYDFPASLNLFSGGALGVGQNIALPYINLVYNEFVQNKTQHLGSILAPSGVKYIVVNLKPPNFGQYVDLVTQFSRKGPIRVEEGTLVGNASAFVQFLDKQVDLTRIFTSGDFIVYKNKMYIPYVKVYASSSLIIGSINSLSEIIELLGFNIYNNLPIFAYQNIQNINTLLKTSTLVFDNTDFNDLLMLLSLQQYGLSFLKPGLQQGWKLLSINSSLFSYWNGYILTETPRNLAVSFNAETDSTYDIWIHLLITPQSGTIKIEVDDRVLSTIKPSILNETKLQWINVGSINLTQGTHVLKLLSNGFSAMDGAVIIPAPILRDMSILATNVFKHNKVILIQDLHTSAFNVTIPAGEYWIGLMRSPPIDVKPEMGVINFDDAEKFSITKENFKPARSLPNLDFDNANYYFYTRTGGLVRIEFKGSALASILIAYNITDISKWHGENQVFLLKPQLVENQTFYFKIPPNSIFQPVIYAYNPEINQNIQDNLNEIIIEHIVEADHPVLSVDNISITRSLVTFENETWVQYGPIKLTSGEHRITLYQSFQVNQPVIISNSNNLSEVFTSDESSIYSNVTKVSWSEYYVNIKTSVPVFLALAESYHSNWVAEVDGQQLPHYVVSSFSNGFYLNKTGAYKITLKFQPTFQNLINFIQELSWAILGLILAIWPLSYRIMRQLKNKKLENTSIQERKHETDN